MTILSATPQDDNRVVSQVHATLDEYERCWAALDFEAMRRLWDDDEPGPIYLAEENRHALVGYEEIEEYWGKTREPLLRARVRTWDRKVKPVASDISVAFFHMRWMVELRDDGPILVGTESPPDGHRRPVGGDVRATAILRKKPSGWRFIHYVEAPLGFLSQLVVMHESWVDDDFTKATSTTDTDERKDCLND